MTKDEIEQVAKCAAKQAVDQTLERLGFDVSNPIETQKDVAFTRRQRVGAEEFSRYTKRGAVLIALSGLAWALWEGIKLGLRAKGAP